jgi:hypothetical protein
MAAAERVTVTLPGEVVREIDRMEKNRSRFVLDAVQREIDRRRRDELRRSLMNPHAEIEELAEMGLDDWATGLPPEETEGLVDPSAGKPVRWVPGKGWESAEG